MAVGRGAAEVGEQRAFPDRADVDMEGGSQVPVYRDLPGPTALAARHPEAGLIPPEVHVPDLQVDGFGHPEAGPPLYLEQHPGLDVIDD